MKKYFQIIKLIALLILAPSFIYALAISNTIKLYKDYKHEISYIKQLEPTNDTCQFEESEPIISSGLLMRLMSQVCQENNVKLCHYFPEEISKEGDVSLVAAKITIAGKFIGLLRVVNSLNEFKNIKICYASFNTHKPTLDNREVMLELKIIQVEGNR